MTKAKPSPSAREPTVAEQASIKLAHIEQQRKTAERINPAAFVAKKVKGDAVQMSPPHSDFEGWRAQILAILGTTSGPYADMLTMQMANVMGAKPDAAAESINQALAFMAGVQPRNEVEAALGAQMWAVHVATMDSFRRLAGADTIPRQEAFGNLAVKLARTLTAQADALAKLRSGGKQTVEVRYIYVDARGSQNVLSTGGAGENGQQPHGPAALAHLAASGCPPLWSAEQGGGALPVSSHEGAQEMPAARGAKPRRASRASKRRLEDRSLLARGEGQPEGHAGAGGAGEGDPS